MISLRTKAVLTKFLLGLAKLEELAEKQRVNLCRITDFEPYTYFLQITNSEKMLQLDHLTQLTHNSIKVQGLIAVILAHDTTHCGYLDYNDFLRMTITNDNLNLRQDVTLRPKGIGNANTTVITKCFNDLLQFEADGYLQLQEIKYELQTRYDFDVYDCFKCLDHKNKGFLNYDDLLELLGNNDLAFYLMRRMNCNSGLKKVNYEHFQKIFKSHDNYLAQYSPDKLIQRKLENKSAQKMYSLYDSFLSVNTRLSTSPSRVQNPQPEMANTQQHLQECKTPIKKQSRNERPSNYYTEPQLSQQPNLMKQIIQIPSRLAKSPLKKNAPAPKENIPQWTPVRKVNANEPHQLKKQFEEKAYYYSNSKVPLRFSPLQTIKNRTPKKTKTQSFFEQKQFNYQLEEQVIHKREKINVKAWKGK